MSTWWRHGVNRHAVCGTACAGASVARRADTHSSWLCSPSRSPTLGCQPRSPRRAPCPRRVRFTSPAGPGGGRARPSGRRGPRAARRSPRASPRGRRRRCRSRAGPVGEPGAERRVDRVGDVGEVARLPAVAEQREARAVEQRLAELAHRHVRALARAVDGEVAQADGSRPRVARRRGEVLARALRHAVGRARARRRLASMHG